MDVPQLPSTGDVPSVSKPASNTPVADAPPDIRPSSPVTRVYTPAILVFLAMAAFVCGGALLCRTIQRDHLQLECKSDAGEYAGLFAPLVESTPRVLHRLRDQIQTHKVTTIDGFHALADKIRQQSPFIKTIVWVSEDGTIKYVSPPSDRWRFPVKDLPTDTSWSAAWARAHTGYGNSFGSAWPTVNHAADIRTVIPIFSAEPSGTFVGALLARISIAERADQAFAPFQADYSMEVRDGSATLYQTSVEPTSVGHIIAHAQLNPLGRHWDLQLTTREKLEARVIDRSSAWILYGGLLISMLVSGLVLQSQRGRAKHDRQADMHLRALEHLNEIATSISGRLEFPREVLDQLAAATRDLLQMERSGIALLEPATGSLNVVAWAGDMPPAPPTHYSMADLPMCRAVLAKREVLFVSDISKVAMPANLDVMRTFRATSLIILPLHIGPRVLGLMTLSNSTARHFTDGERRLARLLASTAAVILSNSEMYTRMASAIQSQRRLLEQREELFAVNAAVYQASTFHDSLKMIVELAPKVLDVDLCVVTLNARENENKVVIAAITKPHGENLIGKRVTRDGTNGAVVKATRRPMVVEDAARDPGVHPVFREQLRIGSIAYMPLLRTEGDFMGMLVLVRHQAGPFSQEQLNLAELFTARAAAAAENTSLLEQTRHDADAKATLLRELNHRVKNNLTAIITLLSLDEPQLAPAAQQWLNRAIDRIRTMARAHDLFSGGMERVALSELIAQTIPSLSVVASPSVSIVSEVTGIEATLRTDRAVSVAMVLHELCYNAIVHGLGGKGTVTIRASTKSMLAPDDKPAHTVLIEVLDDGHSSQAVSRDLVLSGATLTDPLFIAPEVKSGEVPLTPRPARSGIGLTLVDGLVTNELNGKFSLQKTDSGGTIARVEFPVTGDEAGGLDL